MATTTKTKTASKPKGTALATTDKASLPAVVGAAPVMNLPESLSRFQIVKNVTVPQLKFKDGNAFIRIESAIVQQEKLDYEGMSETERKKEPPFMAEVVVLDDNTGEVMRMIFPSVLRKEIERAYPEQSYIGKNFGIQSFQADEERGKRYRTFRIVELALVK